MTVNSSTSSSVRPENVRQRLLQCIGEDEALPAMGGTIARVVKLASSGDDAVGDLAHFILADVALTQKLLRLANTVTYRTASGTPVTTVSKAIFLLGFDTVVTSALAMLLVDGLADRSQAAIVKVELTQALCASVIGREIARRSHYRDGEEASIAALFRNLGRVLVASHDAAAFNSTAGLINAGMPPAQAAQQIIGCSFESLSAQVLHEWQIPESTIAALTPPSPGRLRPARSRPEWLQQVVEFSSDAARLTMRSGTQERLDVSTLLSRYAAALNLDAERLQQIMESALEEMHALTADLGLDLPLKSFAEESQDALPEELLFLKMDSAALHVDDRHPSGKPLNSRDLLLAGVQDVMQMKASGRCKVNELMLLVLETLCRSMGFRFAAICIRDAQGQHYRSRMAIGERHAERQAAFAFPAASGRDLFHLALDNDADLLIADTTTPKIAPLIPAWHRALLPDARSFVILPLSVQGKPIGLFYADRAAAAPEGVPADETTLIKMLKSQVVAALQTH